MSVESDVNPYSSGKIYRILCSDGHFYIGSTINELRYRFNNHKRKAKVDTEQPVYKYINNLGWDNAKIELIENYSCTSKDELTKHEDKFIQQFINDILCLNTRRACFNAKEYREQNKERIDDYMAHYRLENAEKRREYSKEYAATNAEAVKERNREYNAANREKIAEQCKQYAAEHKDQIQEYKNEWARNKRAQASEEKRLLREQKTAARVGRDREIIQCICGGTYQFYQRNRHLENKKHVAFAATKAI